MQIEEVFDPDTRCDQAKLARAILQELERLPEFAFIDVVLFDDLHGRFQQVAHLSNVEQAEAFNAALADFLDRQ